jgi:hypothetical protein
MDEKCLDEMLESRGFVAEPRADGLRWWLSPNGMKQIAEMSSLRGRFVAARDKAKQDAINNLARYKFSNFGYHAARWVTFNQLIGDKQPNPFKDLVEAARKIPGAKWSGSK